MKSFFSVLLLSFIIASSASATTVPVPSYGETGWQTFTHVFANDFLGNFSIIASNSGDKECPSTLLIDNFSDGLNPSFESGYAFSKYIKSGTAEIVKSATSYAGNVYTPTHGLRMAKLISTGADTSSEGGTDGTILVSKIDGVLEYAAGEKWSFDWAFLAYDYYPFQDFAKLVLRDMAGNVIFSEKLSEITKSPIPAAAWIFLTGIAGLAGLRRKNNK